MILLNILYWWGPALRSHLDASPYILILVGWSWVGTILGVTNADQGILQGMGTSQILIGSEI